MYLERIGARHVGHPTMAGWNQVGQLFGQKSRVSLAPKDTTLDPRPKATGIVEGRILRFPLGVALEIVFH